MDLANRKTIRLTGHDYSQAGYYFITICTSDRRFLFGTVKNGEMFLSKTGVIVKTNIEDISNHFSKISVDKFVVMPNHLHLILVVLSDTVCCDADAMYGVPTSADSACNLTDKSKQLVPRAIQQFKASASRQTRIPNIWQKKYHDHIIRDEDDYLNIWRYIDENPVIWEEDKYFQE